MAIARFENLDINNLTFGLNEIGEQTTIQTKWFTTRGRVSSVANSLNILEKYRLYQDLIHFTMNYTPNMKKIIDRQDIYSITWRGNSWRIDNVRESDDRMTVLFLCYRSDPETAV